MNNIPANRSYYDYDLQIEYRKVEDKDLPRKPAQVDNNYFKIIFVMSGAYEIYYKQNVITLNKGGAVIAKRSSDFKINRIKIELSFIFIPKPIQNKNRFIFHNRRHCYIEKISITCFSRTCHSTSYFFPVFLNSIFMRTSKIILNSINSNI